MATVWFESVFGFKEKGYGATKKQFKVLDETSDGKNEENIYLVSLPNQVRFKIGKFEVLSVQDLQGRLTKAQAPCDEGKICELGSMTFKNITGSVKILIRDRANHGAVFQAASQFNCLEMVGPGVSPERGVKGYVNDPTQGPACALGCPGALVYRNYCHNGGQGRGNQIDCLSPVAKVLGAPKTKYWKMANGYALPLQTDSMRKLGDRLNSDLKLRETALKALQIGVHWSTEVHKKDREKVGVPLMVSQMFCSAVPVAYAKSTTSKDWSTFAQLVLDASYEATLLAAGVLAMKRNARVKVYLTMLGGGAFGNRQGWIISAIKRSLKKFSSLPLDVCLVHYHRLNSMCRELETVLKKNSKKATTKGKTDLGKLIEELDSVAVEKNEENSPDKADTVDP
mmetsp:Transcript_45710/g.73500  ORF Transcript_45710/g.73500 Transcript_45710/m.73500 type:complete len:397 (-) Transcript_45710:138-1328(-)